jgi:biopolymer transport protein ExbD
MGVVDQPQREAKGKKGGLKRPKRRIGIRIDMTPMVDIAFLLLIFYMVTTVFSMPQSMEVNLPPKPKEGEAPDQPIARSKLLEILVDAEGNIFWMHTPKGQPLMDVPEYIDYKNLRDFLTQKNLDVAKLVTVLRIDKDCQYEMMVNIIDVIQVVERNFKSGFEFRGVRYAADPDWSYRFSLQDMTLWEFQLMEKAKEAMSMTPTAQGGTL